MNAREALMSFWGPGFCDPKDIGWHYQYRANAIFLLRQVRFTSYHS